MDRAHPNLDDAAENSQRLVRALQSPTAYGHPVGPIEVVETHISWVLLTGTYAYKIKKPVNLGFLDFSTLEGRRHFCHEELRLNRRLAPEFYLDVVPITGTHDTPSIGGADRTPTRRDRSSGCETGPERSFSRAATTFFRAERRDSSANVTATCIWGTCSSRTGES